jgi:uncharacterized membrane protein
VFVCMWLLWWFRGRDRKFDAIVTLYEPPSNMSPAEAGTLADGRVDVRDITATIVDLAVRGYLRIDAKSGHYTFTRRKPTTNADDLKVHESLLLAGLFEQGDSVSVSDLKDHFYTQLTDIKETLYTTLVDHDFYSKRPNDVGSSYVLCGLGIFFAPLAWGFISHDLAGGAFGSPSWATIISCLASGLIVIVFGSIMPRRTRTGAREYAKVQGFQEFLSRVDGDRLERVVKTPELFEKYLPYAMALGVETEWARAFHGICDQPPAWYTGDSAAGSFTPSLFTGQMHRMAVDAGHALTSTPRGSSGSGFSSGSSSGGGFGGGGGGGF